MHPMDLFVKQNSEWYMQNLTNKKFDLEYKYNDDIRILGSEFHDAKVNYLHHKFLIPKAKHKNTMIFMPGLGEDHEWYFETYREEYYGQNLTNTKIVFLNAPIRNVILERYRRMRCWYNMIPAHVNGISRLDFNQTELAQSTEYVQRVS